MKNRWSPWFGGARGTLSLDFNLTLYFGTSCINIAFIFWVFIIWVFITIQEKESIKILVTSYIFRSRHPWGSVAQWFVCIFPALQACLLSILSSSLGKWLAEDLLLAIKNANHGCFCRFVWWRIPVNDKNRRLDYSIKLGIFKSVHFIPP